MPTHKRNVTRARPNATFSAPMDEGRCVDYTYRERAVERELSKHIFVASAQLVGICLTVLDSPAQCRPLRR